MNRLLITILLVLAIAVSFAKFAFAQSVSFMAHAAMAAGKPKTAIPAVSTTSATATPATPTTAATTTSNASLADSCGSDEDCISGKFTDGEDTFNITNSYDSVSKTITPKVTSQVCSTCEVKGVDVATLVVKAGEDLKAGAKEVFKKTKDLLAKLHSDKVTKNKIDTCQIDESTGKPFEKPVIKDTKDDPADYSALTLKELDPLANCQEEKLEALENSTDPAEIKIREKLEKKFEKRLTELAQKPTLTRREKAALENMLGTENEVLEPIVSRVMYNVAQKEQADIVAQLQLATAAIANKNYIGANQILANVSAARNKLVVDATLADKLISKSGLETSDYQARALNLDAILKGQNDFNTTVSSLNKVVASNLKGTIGGIYSGPTSQFADNSVKDLFDANYKIANGILLRSDAANGSMGALNTSTYVREPQSAQCFYLGNCNNLNSGARLRLVNGVGVTGSLASTSGTNYNPMTSIASGSNSFSSAVAAGTNPFTNFGGISNGQQPFGSTVTGASPVTMASRFH